MIRTTSVMVLSLALIGSAAAKDSTIGFDAITTPGHPVDVRTKFERSGWQFWHPDVKNKGVTYTVLGRTSTCRTDGDGVAHVTVNPGATGIYPIVARLDGSSTVGGGRLFVLDPNRPCAFVDLDETISNMAQWLVPLRGDHAGTYPGAVSILTDLSRTHDIIYLTARDEHLNDKSRTFLHNNGFPDGAMIFNDLGIENSTEFKQLSTSNHGKYKLAEIQRLQGRGVHTALGFGNTSTDAFAYEQSGIASYIFDTPSVPAPVPPPSVRFSSWEQDLRGKLIRDGFLPSAVGLAGALAHTP
jgi:phosphatidate phosphatase APP1